MFTTHQPADALIEVLRREHVAYELIEERRHARGVDVLRQGKRLLRPLVQTEARCRVSRA